MVLVSDFCAQILSCSPKSLRDKLNHPEDRSKAMSELFGKKVRTTYKDRNGMAKTFFVAGMTDKAAAVTPAYGRLRQPFNINVAAHFYARHRIKLHFPYLPCIVEGFNRGENRHFPMELLELVDENNYKGRLFGRLFTEIEDFNCPPSTTKSNDDDDEEACQCCRSYCTKPSGLVSGKRCNEIEIVPGKRFSEGIDVVDNGGRDECSQSSYYW